MSSATAPDPVDRLVGFGRFLRREGFPVGPGRVLTFVRSAAILSATEREDLYWAARASLISRHDLIEPFDRAFHAYFGGGPAGDRGILVPDPGTNPGARPEPDGPGDPAERAVSASRWGPADEDEEAEEQSAIRIVAADTETLRSRSFEELTEEERARTAALIRRIAVRAPRRRTRRLRPSEKGNRFDLPRTIRRSLRTEGEPFRRAWRGRRTRLRPLVLILDVSGSMGPFARALLQFAFAAMAAGGRVEVFCFGTELTRVTRSLRTKDPDRALRDIGRLVRDWEGGTRIGESLKELLDGCSVLRSWARNEMPVWLRAMMVPTS